MNGTDPALAHFSRVLKETVDTGNISRLRGFLSGRELPALGGDLEPADIIRNAILEVEEPSAFARRLSGLLSSIVSEEVASLFAGTPLDARRRDLLLNVLHLAVDLPAEKDLFTALLPLCEKLISTDLEISLWQALAYQQVDSSLEGIWIAFLSSSKNRHWTPARRTLLLTAWRGLLWIPPDPKSQNTGEIIDFDRVERGLTALYSDRRHAEATGLIKTALAILEETYPRSRSFWQSFFRRVEHNTHKKWIKDHFKSTASALHSVKKAG